MDDFSVASDYTGSLCSLSSDYKRSCNNRHERQCGLGNISRQLYLFYGDKLCRCINFGCHAPFPHSLEETYYPNGRINNGNFIVYRTSVYFTLYWKIRPTTLFSGIRKNPVSNYLGCYCN